MATADPWELAHMPYEALNPDQMDAVHDMNAGGLHVIIEGAALQVPPNITLLAAVGAIAFGKSHEEGMSPAIRDTYILLHQRALGSLIEIAGQQG